MGFHKRHIRNEQVIKIFNDSGINCLIDWYTEGVDTLITETGLASDILNVIESYGWLMSNPIEMEESIIKRIHKELNKK